MYICIYIHTWKWLPIWWLNSAAISMVEDQVQSWAWLLKRKDELKLGGLFIFTTWLKSFTSPICNKILVDLSQTENEIHLKFCSAKDDLCVLDRMNKSVFCSYQNFQRTASSRFLNISGSVLSKNKKLGIKKLWILVISKTLKEPVGFMKEPAAGQLFDFFNSFETCDYMPELGLWFLRTVVMCPKNRPDNHWGPVPVSNNCPTLEQTNKQTWDTSVVRPMWWLMCIWHVMLVFTCLKKSIMSSFSQTWSTGGIESLQNWHFCFKHGFALLVCLSPRVTIQLNTH